MFFNVFEHIVVGVGDDKAFAEDVDDGSDVEVLRSIVGRRLRQTARPSYATTVEVLATCKTGVAYWRLVDGQRVV